MSTRQKWTKDEDELLRECVMEYTGNGDPKSAAFKTAAAKLSRSAAACSNRWFLLSKEQTAEKRDIQLSDVITFLENGLSADIEKENEELEMQKQQLEEQNRLLKEQLEEKLREYEDSLQQHEEMKRLFEETGLFEGEMKRVVH